MVQEMRVELDGLHIPEEIGSAITALKLLGNDVVAGSRVHLAIPALEDPWPTQRLYKQPPHDFQFFFYGPSPNSQIDFAVKKTQT